MTAFWTRLCADVEVKQQLVTVALVAVVVMIGEAYLYFQILTPEVHGSVRTMLRDLPLPATPAGARTVLQVLLGTAEARERTLMDNGNTGAVVNTVLIVLTPLLFVGLLFLGSSRLRAAPLWPILVDVFAVLVLVGLFEGLFFLFAHRWAFPSTPELAMAVVEQYRTGAPVADVASAQRLAARWHGVQTQAAEGTTRRRDAQTAAATQWHGAQAVAATLEAEGILPPHTLQTVATILEAEGAARTPR
jgi:hypothetical protein